MTYQEAEIKIFELELEVKQISEDIKVSVDILKQNSKLMKCQIIYTSIVYISLLSACIFLC